MKQFKFPMLFIVTLFICIFSFTNQSKAQEGFEVSGYVFDEDGWGYVHEGSVIIYEHGTSIIIGSSPIYSSGYYSVAGVTGTVDIVAYPDDKIEDYVPTSYPTPLTVITDLPGIDIYLNRAP